MSSSNQIMRIEVIVGDSIMNVLGSVFGHAALHIGNQVYSRWEDKYAELTMQEYLDKQQPYRNSTGYVLKVTSKEMQITKNEIIRRVAIINSNPHPEKLYNLENDNCTVHIAEAFEKAGIIIYDQRWSFGAISPRDLTNGLIHSKRLTLRNFYPKIPPRK